MDKINLIDGEYGSWVSVNHLNFDAEIADRVQVFIVILVILQ